MKSLIAELELRELRVEKSLLAFTGWKKIPTPEQEARLRSLAGEYLEWHKSNFGRLPKVHPLRRPCKFLKMRKLKSKIPLPAVA